MSLHLFHLPIDSSNSHKTLQTRVREMIISAIFDGYLQPGERLPSPRKLGKELGMARNTIIEAYRLLTDDGYLDAKERRGYFVTEHTHKPMKNRPSINNGKTAAPPLDWARRLMIPLTEQRNIVKTRNWQSFRYPFITGQLDADLFPAAAWRKCCHDALNSGATLDWAADHFDTDNPILLDQLRSRLLPGRGINAAHEEILITMGAQHALYMLSSLLMRHKVIGLEEPGYPDARNIFSLKAERLVNLPMDDEGLIIGSHLSACDYVYVTPGHQSPTTVTLSLSRRHALLAAAQAYDFVILEDDYESGINFVGNPLPSLYSLDRCSRVIYIGSLSKILAPGLRLGYLVAAEELIQEARSLRRLMLRHAPGNNESAIALFLSGGYYDSLVRRLRRVYQERWEVMQASLQAYLPQLESPENHGGTAFWLKGPDTLDCRKLQRIAAQHSILIEPGDVYFQHVPYPLNYFRLGITSIPTEQIEPGIKKLATLMNSTPSTP